MKLLLDQIHPIDDQQLNTPSLERRERREREELVKEHSLHVNVLQTSARIPLDSKTVLFSEKKTKGPS